MADLDTKVPILTLPDGNKIPMLSFGVGTAWYKASPGAEDKATTDAVLMALKMGYHHIDGAEVYNTESEMGTAIKAAKIPRNKLFITTKVIVNIQDIPSAIDASLKKLGLDYVDLYLIHAPYFAKEPQDLQKKWSQMEDVLRSGKAKSIGVSNFLAPDLDTVLETCAVRPQINQIEFHAYLQHATKTTDLLAYHRSKDIKLAAYAPLVPVTKASSGPLTPYLEELAKKYAVSPSEILLRWVIDQGIVAVTTSGKEQRLSDYMRVCAFQLNPKEIEEIAKKGREYHYRAFWQDKFDKEDRS